MQYTYVAGIVIIAFFAAMYITERMWGKEVKSVARGPVPAPAARPQPAAETKGKKGKKR